MRIRRFVHAVTAFVLLCGSVASAQTTTIIEKVPSEIVLGRDLANLLTLTNRPDRLPLAETQQAIDETFALFVKRLPVAATHGPESVLARSLLRPQPVYDEPWRGRAQQALSKWRTAMLDTWHPKTLKHVAAFYIGEDTQEINNNALVEHSANTDSVFRTELAKITQLDGIWSRLREARTALVGAPAGDWDTIAKRSTEMLAVLEDSDDLYTPIRDSDP